MPLELATPRSHRFGKPEDVVFLFSGQGSQAFHMGSALYRAEPMFRDWFDRCWSVVEPHLGSSLADVVYPENRTAKDPFDFLPHSHPALVAFQFSLARLVIDSGLEPDIVVGYSVGEIVAAMVSGALTLEQGMHFAVEIALELERDMEPARMLTILAHKEAVEEELQRAGDCWLVADNFDGHFVVTGRTNTINALKERLLEAVVPCQELPIHRGFHSPMIEPFEEQLAALAPNAGEVPARLGVVSCASQTTVERFDHHHWWQVARGPVYFRQVIARLEANGPKRYVDLSPSGTLATLVKYAQPKESQSSSFKMSKLLSRHYKAGRDATAVLSEVRKPLPTQAH